MYEDSFSVYTTITKCNDYFWTQGGDFSRNQHPRIASDAEARLMYHRSMDYTSHKWSHVSVVGSKGVLNVRPKVDATASVPIKERCDEGFSG